MAIDARLVSERRDVWEIAQNLVDPIVDKHGVEPYGVGPANVFTTPPSKMTKVDQHIGSIIQVAEWLMEGE